MDKQPIFDRLFERAKAIIFDFDGVLADSEKHHYASYRDVFARYGHTVDETEYYKYWTSLGRGPKGEIDRHGLDLDPADIRDEKRPVFTEYCRNGTIQLYPEAREIIERLSRAGKILTIASGTVRSDIDAVLRNAGLGDKFREIIGSDTVVATKPAPDIFVAVMDQIHIQPSDCLVIEDAEKGMYAAITAGIPVVVVRTNETKGIDFEPADLTLDSHTEWLDLTRTAFPD